LVAVTPWLAEPSGQRKSRIRTPVAPIWRPGPPRTTEKMPPGSRRFDCRVVLKVITQQATALLWDRADQVNPQKLVAIKESRRGRAQSECRSRHSGQGATDASPAPASPYPHTKTTRSAYQNPVFGSPEIPEATNHIRNGLSGSVFRQPAKRRR
jgi:hypothetical protein